MENWKPVPGWPLYEVSDQGRIRRTIGSGKRGEGGILKGRIGKDGRIWITLRSEGWRKDTSLHVLILRTFVGHPVGKRRIGRHLDDDPSNNKLINLAWGSKRDNALDAIKNGKSQVGEDCSWSKLKEADVVFIRETYVPLSREFGGAALARRFGVSPSLVSQIVNRDVWKQRAI